MDKHTFPRDPEDAVFCFIFLFSSFPSSVPGNNNSCKLKLTLIQQRMKALKIKGENMFLTIPTIIFQDVSVSSILRLLGITLSRSAVTN